MHRSGIENRFKVQRIKFSVDLCAVINLNHDPVLDKINNLLSLREKIFLTPFEKITVIKALILSKLNHLFMFIPNPDKIIQDALFSNLSRIISQTK